MNYPDFFEARRLQLERDMLALLAGTYKPRMRPVWPAATVRGWCVRGLGHTVYADTAAEAYETWQQHLREALA
jgi:hypothetical protein